MELQDHSNASVLTLNLTQCTCPGLGHERMKMIRLVCGSGEVVISMLLHTTWPKMHNSSVVPLLSVW